MGITVSHVLSATTPDDPLYEIQPKHWNSAHAYTLNAVGSEISGAFSNGGGVSFGLETNGFITASAPLGGGGLTNINLSAGTTSNNLSKFAFADSNGVSFGLNGSTVTATVATNYRASNDAVGLNSALTAGPLAWTVNSNGISLNASSAAGTTSGFGGNLISGSMTHNTAGLNISLNHPAWLTTAMQSDAQTISNINVSAGTTSNNRSNLVFANGNNVSFGLNNGTITATVTLPGGTDTWVATGNNTIAGTNTTGTFSNDSYIVSGGGGISVGVSNNTLVFSNVPAQHTHGAGPTLNVTNLLTSATSASDGLTININNVDAHVNGWQLTGNTAGTTSTQVTTTAPVFVSGGPNITVSGNSNTLVISGPAAGGTTFYTGSYFANFNNVQATTTMTWSGSTLHMASFSIQQNMSIDFLRVFATGSVLAASSTAATTGNTSYGGGSTKSHNLILYTRGVGANSMSLQAYGSTQDTERAAWTISAAANSTQFSYSLRYSMNSNSGSVGFTKDYSSSAASLNFHSSHLTDLTGLKQYEIPFQTILTPGQYWLGYQVLTSMSTARTADESRWGLAYSTFGVTSPQLSFGVLGSASNSHFGLMPMVGSITTNATTTTASFPLTNITSSSNNAVMFFQAMRIT